MLDRAFGYRLELEEGATTPFAGGIMQHGYQCGMIWGATLAAGAEAYRRLGPGPGAETAALRAARRVVGTFRTRHDDINCLEITDIDKDSSTWEMVNFFLIKGGTIECFRMASWFAPLAYEAIDSELRAAESEGESAEGKGNPRLPVSCAAVLAKKLGLSKQQTVMAAGLAGGIGLCGGACGALGTAIWALGMKTAKEDGKRIGYKDSRTQAVIDRFLEETEFRFECSEIAGREFENVDDHAAYLQGGGCSELIEALAAS